MSLIHLLAVYSDGTVRSVCQPDLVRYFSIEAAADAAPKGGIVRCSQCEGIYERMIAIADLATRNLSTDPPQTGGRR